jgi:NAD(P)-dependent dehydrogenase (short-subunit alcohol dehydrogenase family)
MNLDDAVVIVTGSATGVGAACARRLAAKGARVVVNYTRSATEAEATRAACAEAGGDAIAVQADIAADADCRRLAQAALDRWGRIDALVNNAATTKFGDPADLEALASADFARILGVNVIGTYQMTRAVAPAMRARGGAIVNVSSNVAETGGGSSVAYTASKGAVNAMTRALARLLGPEIRVNAVCPGVIDTRWMRDGLTPEAFAALRRRFEETAPLRRMCSADDVAEPIVWLLEGADFVTGETIFIDGGIRLAGGAPKPR